MYPNYAVSNNIAHNNKIMAAIMKPKTIYEIVATLVVKILPIISRDTDKKYLN